MRFSATYIHFVSALLILNCGELANAQFPSPSRSPNTGSQIHGSRLQPLATSGGGGGNGGGQGGGTLGGQDISFKLAFRSFDLPLQVANYTTGGINASGDIVGSYCLDPACITSHGYKLHANTLTNVDFPGAPLNTAEGINDLGEIVGWYWDPFFISTHGAIFPMGPFDLCGPNQQTRYLGVNGKGEIAATCGASNSYLLTHFGISTLSPDAFPNGFYVTATGINSIDQFVGYFVDSTATYHAFTGGFVNGVLATPTLVDFPGAQSTQPFGINDAGQIVGQAFDSANGHGFLCALPVASDCFKKFDVLVDGVRAGYTLPTGINSIGEIVGQYGDSSGGHGFTAIPFTTSYYIKTTNSNTLKSMGENFATDQINSGFQTRESYVALLFGAPTYNKVSGEYGTTTWGRPTPVSTIASLAEDFVSGYYNKLGNNNTAHLHLIISTSNSITACGGSQVNFAHGNAWGHMVSDVASWVADQRYSAQVDIAGGSDMEINADVLPSKSPCQAGGKFQWAGRDETTAWIQGYAAAAPNFWLYNLGDATDCPTTAITATAGRCSKEWTQDSLWYISWGATPSVPFPEIYSVSQAKEWAGLGLYGYLAYGNKIFFAGVLTQSQACGSSNDCDGADNTPSQGWEQFYDAINADLRIAQNITVLTDLKSTAK